MKFSHLLCLPVKVFRYVYADGHLPCLNDSRNSAGVSTSTPRSGAPVKSLLLYVRIVAPRCAASSTQIHRQDLATPAAFYTLKARGWTSGKRSPEICQFRIQSGRGP